jgi:hypothetical protein
MLLRLSAQPVKTLQRLDEAPELRVLIVVEHGRAETPIPSSSKRWRVGFRSLIRSDGVARMARIVVRSGSGNRSLDARIPLNRPLEANGRGLPRTLRRVDKLGVTGSSPVPPTRKRPAKAGLSFAQSRTTRRPCPQNVRSGAERSRLRRFPAEISSSATKTDEFAN